MAKSVSNDALWEKLSEMDKKFEKCIVMQESQTAAQEQEGNTPGFEDVKDVIIAEIRQQTALQNRGNESNFQANTQNVEVLKKNILLAVKHSRETKEQLKNYFESRKRIRKATLTSGYLRLEKRLW